MLLIIFILLLTINIIGFFNRKRAWAKIFLVSQVFVVGGLVVMFNVYTGQSGIEGLEAKKKKAQQELPSNIDDIKNLATEKNKQVDTLDYEKENQKGNQVKF
jgi:hypothetical protein